MGKDGECITKRYKVTADDENIHYLDCVDSLMDMHISKSIKFHTLNICIIL